MKALRILLQFVIVGAGGMVLLALISRPTVEMETALVLSGSVALLLALTFVLKAHTGKRLHPERGFNSRPIGVLLLLLGAFGIFQGVGFLLGSQPLPGDQGTCKALCGLILLTAHSFGEYAARLLAFGLWAGLGAFLGFVGYKVKDARIG